MTLSLFVAGEDIERSCVGELANDLNSLKLLKCKGDLVSFECAGLIAAKGRLTLVLPRAYKSVPVQTEWEGAARLLLAALRRYAADQSKQRSVTDRATHVLQSRSAEMEHGLARFESALALLSDARKNGPFYVASRREDSSRGCIHWRRTLERWSPAGHPYCEAFPKFVMVRSSRDPAHPLTRLHGLTVASAASLLGLGTKRGPTTRSADALRVIRTYESTLYTDRGRFLSELLRRYYLSMASEEAGHFQAQSSYLLTTHFYQLWESMLKVALGPVEPSVGLRGRYLARNGKKIHKGLKLTPDILIRDGHELFIVDAKDYPEGDFPLSKDITKQIIYRLLQTDAFALTPGLPVEATRSAFIFPSIDHVERPVRGRGVHRVACGDELNWCTVACLNVSYERVAAAYLADRPDAVLRENVLSAIRETWQWCAE